MSHGFLFIILTGIIFTIVMAHDYNVQATTQPTSHYNILAIEYSPGCATALKNHIDTSCPTLDKLVKYDTSNQYYSGKFINGNTSRVVPQFKNHYMIYNYAPYNSKMVVCIVCDVPLGNPDVFKTLFIESGDFIYLDHSQIVKNNTYNTYNGRYTTPDCMSATIAYSDSLLNDTINYMGSGCTITNFNGNKTNTIKDTPFQKNNPYSSLNHYAWLKKIKDSPIQNCIFKKCATPPNPYTKSNWNKKG